MDLSHGGEQDSNIGKKHDSNPSNPIRKNKRSKIEVDRGNLDTGDGGDSDESDARKNSTTNMKQMELNCKKDPNQSEDRLGEGSNSNLDSNFFGLKCCKDALSRMIIMDKLPFRIVECEGFRNFFLLLHPNLIIPSCETVVTDCFQLYDEEMEGLQRMLVEKEQRVCLTAETWTSMQALDYMALTAHFIDDGWKLQKKILNFCLIPDRKGDTIGKTIEKRLMEWEIEKVFTVMVDSASYIDGDLAYLTEKMRNQNGVVLNGDFAPIVNVMACDALKELHGSTIKIRSAIEYVKSSPEVSEAFRNFAMNEKIPCAKYLCLDIPTKWNSTYTMLDNALKFQKAFERLDSEDEKFCLKFIENELKKVPPLNEDWDNVRAFLELLRFFRRVTLKLLGSPSCVTSHDFFHKVFVIKKEIEKYSNSDNSLLANTARNMKVKYEKFLEDNLRTNFLLYVSIVLDPRYKLDFLSFGLSYYEVERPNEIRKKIEDMTRSLYNEFQTSNMESESSCNSEEEDEDEDEDEVSTSTKYSIKQDAWYNKSELDKYLSEPCEPLVETFNILDWWRMKSSKYPILGKMAKDILTIPLSTNVLESAFNTGDRVLDLYHSSLPPKAIEIIICLRSWLCSQKNINPNVIADDPQLQELVDEGIQQAWGQNNCY